MKHLTKSQLRAMYAGRKNYTDPSKHEQQKHNQHLYDKEREPFYKETDGKQDYDIVRFYANHRNPRVMIRARDRRFAEKYCSRPDTRKDGEWFDGFAKCGEY